MKRAIVAAVVLLVAHGARAQCKGDFNGDGMVSINELIIAVNNALNGCQGSAPTPTPTPLTGSCPINFSDDNTGVGTPDCYYTGRWNQTCGAADLVARFISDGSVVVIDFQGFNPGLFLGASVTSPTTADLIAWFTVPNPTQSDLNNLAGSVTLNDGGNTLVAAPTTVPFKVDNCDFVLYQGALTQVVQSGAQTAVSSQRIEAGLVEKLRAFRAALTSRPNFQRH
jgi:hypothetical protein